MPRLCQEERDSYPTQFPVMNVSTAHLPVTHTRGLSRNARLAFIDVAAGGHSCPPGAGNTLRDGRAGSCASRPARAYVPPM